MTPINEQKNSVFKAQGPGQRLRRYLIAGLLLWIPLGVTIIVLRFVVGLLGRGVDALPVQFQLEQLLGFSFPGMHILFFVFILVVTLLATGAFVANFFGKQFVSLWERVLNRIPLVRTVYNSVKQVAETVLSDSNQSFKKVLLVEYPRRGSWCIGFQTSSALGEVQARTGKQVVCVFVPTTPNPTSGFIIMVPADEVTELDMSVDAAIKMVISMGVIVPEWQGQAPTNIAPPQQST